MKTNLSHNNRKVLIGFKCNSSLKTELCSEAKSLGITLSTHVENIVENQSNSQLEVANLKKQILDLNEQLSSYEVPHLKKLFEMSKGQATSYIDHNGEAKNITINSIQDLYEVIIHSFNVNAQ